MIKKVISGGQTGADRAALDVGIKMDVLHGGWIPKGHRAEDRVLLGKYLGNWTGTLLSKILPVRGSRSITKGRKRSYGLRKTRMKGVSSGRKETIVRVNYVMLEGLRLKGKFGDVNMVKNPLSETRSEVGIAC